MSFRLMPHWQVTCDRCGKQAVIDTGNPDCSPSNRELQDHGFRLNLMWNEEFQRYDEAHLCADCFRRELV